MARTGAPGPIPAACELLESGVVAGEQLPVLFDYLLVRTLAEQLLRERPELDRFSGSVHETRRTQFVRLDKRSISLTRQLIAQIRREEDGCRTSW